MCLLKHTKRFQLLVKNLYLIFFPGMTESNYKDFTKGSPHREKSALPTPDLVHSQCIPVSEESSNQGLMPLGQSGSSHIYVPSPDSKFISEAFTSVLGQITSLGTSAETSLWWIGRKTSKTLFPTLTQHPVLFHSSSSPSTSSISGSINMAEPFVQGSLDGDDLHICADPSDPQMAHCSIGENETRESLCPLLGFRLLLIKSQQMIKSFNSFTFGFWL